MSNFAPTAFLVAMMWWTAQNDVLLHRNRRLARTFRLRCLWCLTQSRTLKARWAYDCSRSAKGVEPTIYAKTLLKRSNAVFDELREGIKDIEALADFDLRRATHRLPGVAARPQKKIPKD